jgi:hypothetical protein
MCSLIFLRQRSSLANYLITTDYTDLTEILFVLVSVQGLFFKATDYTDYTESYIGCIHLCYPCNLWLFTFPYFSHFHIFYTELVEVPISSQSLLSV